jgi:hypothetical protein
MTACDKKDHPPSNNNENGNRETITLSGNITQNMTLKAQNRYMLNGFVYVKEGATLTIEPGTVIMGVLNTKAALIIERGAKIMAEGTREKPIVFTSAKPPGERTYGDWGGIIVCGRAPINVPGNEAVVEGGTNALFGGNDPNDNSGVIKYVRIEFCGIEFVTFQEINGLTLAGVGNQTVVEYVQVSYSGDDAFECFGGTVNAKHLVAFRTWDDDFDTDLGYTGKMQFLVGVRDPFQADVSNSNGIESDNDPNGTASQPNTRPIYSNLSLFGPLPDESFTNRYDTQHRRGLWIQNRSKASVFNSVVAGWPVGLQIDGRYTAESARNGEIVFQNNLLAGVRKDEAHYGFYYSIPSSQFDIRTWARDNATGVDTFNRNAELKIADPFNLDGPNPLPLEGSPALTDAKFDHPLLNDPFFEKVNYRGAFGNDDWTAGWTNWNPVSTDYSK